MTRPDGSLPPSPRVPWHDRYARCRRRSGLHPGIRARLDQRRHELVQELERLDAETGDWLGRRRTVLAEALDLHDQLWPAQANGWVRRPPKPGARWMPPLPEPARRVSGWNLRHVAQGLLQRFGPLALPDLHALLHRYGYEVESRHPVKALADALGYEVLEGRAERVRRGVYRTLMDPDDTPQDLDPTFVTNDLSPDVDSVDPVTPPTIEPSRAHDSAGLRALILGIQHDEFGFDITWDDQPDLHDIDGFYRSGGGQFWVARADDGTVVGSIGLRDCGDGLGALRKMFVAPGHRGRGPDGQATPVAQRLLDTLLAHAHRTGFTTILLGTTERFEAAHRFYEKHGFERVDETTLPPTFPRMAVDTRFYRLDLTA